MRMIQTSMVCMFFIAMITTAATGGDKERESGKTISLAKKTEDRARYVIKIAGCNDCHTTGYAEAAGKIPE
jgi:hypothetical protein